MKKSIILTLALVFVLGIAGTAFAANPFVDVPAKHWAYDAVAKLAQAGIVDGYGDGTFKGDKTMTRYEMAQIVAKAMARSDKANAEQKAAIDKLSVEFSTELNNMGVRVAALEKKAAADRVNFTGEYRARYNNTNNDVKAASGHNFANLLQIDANAKINDDWTATMRWEAYKNNYNDQGYAGSSNVSGTNDGHYDITRAYVSGPIAGVQLTAGKFGNTISTGITFDDNATGAAIQFGNKLKTTLAVVQANSNFNNNNGNTGYANAKAHYAQFNYDFSKATSAVASYQVWKDSVNTVANSDLKIWDLGFDFKMGSDWTAQLKYAHSSNNIANAVNKDNRAWMAGVQYLKADINKVGSWDVFAHYIDMGQYTTTADYTFDGGFAGMQQWGLGFDYVPAKNIKFHTVFYDAKANAHNNMGVNGAAIGEGQRAKFFRSQVEFFF
ncbi:S-layer homology domain-containing protein [Azotosporobacter soli]|uniref:S-layer homology domain-containing protein n=1 Tax=Azotosporobacter soli TaxID=3055040 RepID=UPI0031FF1A23